MSLDYIQDSPICFQQKTTGAMDGSVAGYAIRAYSVGGVVGQFRSLGLGPAGANTIEFVDTGVATALSVKNQGGNMKVFLGRSDVAITSTLAQVAAALSAFRDASGSQSPVLLGVTTDGTVTAALAAVAMTGGSTPTQDGALVRFDLAAAACGLVYFDDRYQTQIVQIEVVIGAGTLKVEIVNLNDGLLTLAGESTDITAWFQGTAASKTLVGNPFCLASKQAIKITGLTAATNTVRVWARRAGTSL